MAKIRAHQTALGIDLGTTYSAVAYVHEQQVQLLNSVGRQLVPSVVAFTQVTPTYTFFIFILFFLIVCYSVTHGI